MTHSLAPPCLCCGHIYLHGSRDICSACLRTQATHPGDPAVKPHRQRTIRCVCGKPAVAVLIVRFPSEEGYYTQRIPLCPSCLRLEREMWE